ncbi:MAG: hypothetical protein CMK71_04080 [Pseudomonadaceae bacterium]|nr:hypothetical protein [Pseudomonadaceae bacterium]|tara:strand:- start:50 stop:784 length:735 start_codon:yes stop_codon:yes gene_type:complete
MPIESKIIEKLKKALHTSCDDAFCFSDDETQLIDAEYLLTVNAAKAIQELNHYMGTPYKIRLEHDTGKFSTACTPLFGKKPANNFIGHSIVTRSRNNTKRPGKIDIAIYTNSNGIDTPLCAIEVKGFKPSKELVTQDLERNAEYFGFTSRTGNSTLPFAAFIALHSYRHVWSDEKEKKNLIKVENRYKKIIDKNKNLNKLTNNINIFTIRRGTLPAHDDPDIQIMGLQGNEDYHFIGVVITTKI